jgi:hypothetical protein
MNANPIIHGVFGHFQNLNLIVLLDDLRAERAAQGAWAAGRRLCPVAHGMPAGQVVNDLRFLGQAADLERGCDYAARHLGADPVRVHQFVKLWDSHSYAQDWLLGKLEDLWQERLMDADAVQELISGGAAVEGRLPSRELLHR